MSEWNFQERVQVSFAAHGVAEVALTRADKMNALDTAMFEALLQVGECLAGLHDLRAVVLHGLGRAFCAGLDMGNFAKMAQGDDLSSLSDLVPRTHGMANHAQQVVWQWRALPVPVVAAVQGVAFGGGLQLALGADIRYAAPETRMSVLEIQWGLVPDMAGIALLRELVRADVARELVYTGRIVQAEEACQLGLVTAVHADPLAQARAFAQQVAARNPDAVRADKRLLNAMTDGDEAALLLAESTEQQVILGSANQREAVRAQQERRAPAFTPAQA